MEKNVKFSSDSGLLRPEFRATRRQVVLIRRVDKSQKEKLYTKTEI